MARVWELFARMFPEAVNGLVGVLRLVSEGGQS